MYQINYKLGFLLLAIFIYTGICAQTTTSSIDSLKSILKEKSGHGRYEILYQLAYDLFDVDNREASVYARQAYDLAYDVGDSLKIVTSGRLAGQIYRRIEQLETSIDVLKEVLPIAKRNSYEDEEKKILNALALTHTLRAEYDEALKYNFQLLVILGLIKKD